MQENSFTDWPIPHDALKRMVIYAKDLPSYQDALPIIGCLEAQFRGCLNQEAFEMIDSIKKHFKDENDKKYEKERKAIIDKRLSNILGGSEFELDDDQIAAAIIKTAFMMDGHRDWGGIYIVLVDCCHWPEGYKEFERRVIQLDLNKMPAEKAFTYQGLQAGFNNAWPKKYKKWLLIDGDETFCHRREVATTFYNYLKAQAKTSSSY